LKLVKYPRHYISSTFAVDAEITLERVPNAWATGEWNQWNDRWLTASARIKQTLLNFSFCRIHWNYLGKNLAHIPQELNLEDAAPLGWRTNFYIACTFRTQ
jgi:hypothetical protein